MRVFYGPVKFLDLAVVFRFEFLSPQHARALVLKVGKAHKSLRSDYCAIVHHKRGAGIEQGFIVFANGYHSPKKMAQQSVGRSVFAAAFLIKRAVSDLGFHMVIRKIMKTFAPFSFFQIGTYVVKSLKVSHECLHMVGEHIFNNAFIPLVHLYC